jgi:hypothetical protein
MGAQHEKSDFQSPGFSHDDQLPATHHACASQSFLGDEGHFPHLSLSFRYSSSHQSHFFRLGNFPVVFDINSIIDSISRFSLSSSVFL